jgi:ATP-dependent DNA ligase
MRIAGELVQHFPISTGKVSAKVAQQVEQTYSQTKVLTPVKLSSPSQVSLYLKHCLKLGYEGCVLRSPQGGYHFGRPPQAEGLLLRHKPLTDSEAIIIGFTELEHNDNEPTISPTGRTVRSTCLSGKVAGNTLGSFLVRDSSTGVEFSVGGGTGLTQKLRKEVWSNREAYLGTILRYSFLGVGTKHKPRQPKFTGFRDERDLS